MLVALKQESVLYKIQKCPSSITVCRLRFKKNFKYFNRDPHRIVSYGLQVENKDSLKSYIEGQILVKLSLDSNRGPLDY